MELNHGVNKHCVNLGVFTLSVVVAIVLCEFFLRGTGVVKLPGRIPNTTFVGRFGERENKEFRIFINSEGLRSPEILATKSRFEKRIFVIGDSHMDGPGVDQKELVAYRLEKWLNESHRNKTSVLNLSAAGTSLYNGLAAIQSHRKWQPDLIVIVLFSGNDLFELYYHYRQKREGKEWSREALNRTKVVLRSLRFYHALVQFRDRIWFQPKKTSPFVQGLGQADYFLNRPKDLAFTLRLFDRYLRLIQREIGTQTKVIVAILPPKLLVDRDYQSELLERVRSKLNLDLTQLEEFNDYLYREILTLVKRHFSQWIDLRIPLEKAMPERPKYWSEDWHLNPYGHQIVAEELVKPIEQNLYALPNFERTPPPSVP